MTLDRIIFVGLNQPSGHHRLVVKMSQTTSTGVSSGWNNIVIITPAFYSDWGDADITEAYIDRIGFAPVPGQKYLISFWWMDTETGFTGESMAVSTICGELSNVNKELYKVRPRMNFSDEVLSDPSVKVYHMGTTLKKLGEGHESYDKAGHSLVTNGGRVLMVLASAPDLKSAHDKALEAVSKVDCDNLFHRTDIGHWAFE